MMVNTPNLNGMKVLITGGAGFIGSNLAHQCLELGAHVTIYDNLDPNMGGNLYNLHDIRDAVELRFHDILDYDRLVDCVMGKDIIFNCAASTSHSFSMREPWLDLDANSRGTINLLEALRRINLEAKLVHIGTSTQLGKLQYQPADENHPEFPLDVYSANKGVSEKYVLIYARAHKMRAAVIRLSNVYGPRASIHSPDFTFNNYFIGLALQGRAISVFGDGRQKRNVVYVEDVVEALLIAAFSADSDGETFFAVGDEHFSLAQIAQLTVKIIGKGSVSFVDWPHERKSIEIGDAVLSNQKIKQKLGWVPKVDLQTGLSRTRDYYSECLEEYIK
jgi:UDP-glucose 4-epimerase